MNRKRYLKKIVKEFEAWWIEDPQHRSKMDFYQETITASHLSSLSKKKFVDFFYDFVSRGGRVQSGGERSKNLFRNTVENDINNFRKFVLKPFQVKFSLKAWFLEIEDFSNFGVGIATIFLNRVDHNKYPIMNTKTLKALNKLGYKISLSKNWSNYELVKKHQDDLVNEFPILQNYYKADALNHFIVAVYEGQELIADYLQIENFENELEQHEIETSVEIDSEEINKDELYKKIIGCEKSKSKKIKISRKTYKRHNYLMVLIKKYRGYKCQFCSTRILKANYKKYYIEACHIKSKAEGGKDSISNILVLCPNCHKLFDYGKRSKEENSKDIYQVTINGKEYKASLK